MTDILPTPTKRKNRAVRKLCRYVYRFSATLYGDHPGRKRKQMTTHRKLTIYGEGFPVTDYTETDQLAWTVFRGWLETEHPGEGVCVIGIDRETWKPFGVQMYSEKIYHREHWNETRRPEPLPERMPRND